MADLFTEQAAFCEEIQTGYSGPLFEQNISVEAAKHVCWCFKSSKSGWKMCPFRRKFLTVEMNHLTSGKPKLESLWRLAIPVQDCSCLQ